MKNIKLIIEYDGKDFNGWQKQPNKLNIQGEIEKAIEEVTGEKVDLIASGRTDAGVHAIGQVANFRLEKDFPVDKIPYALVLGDKERDSKNVSFRKYGTDEQGVMGVNEFAELIKKMKK